MGEVLHMRADMPRTVTFYSIVAAIAVIGLLVLFNAARISCWFTFLPEEFVVELGKALLIASLLAGSVDIYLKRRLATEFVRDVSPFIEGLGLPIEFQDEIAFIRRIPVYRKDLRITYRFVPLDGARAGYVQVKTTAVFTLVNQTEIPQKHEFVVGCEDAYPAIGASHIVGVGLMGLPEGPKTWSIASGNFGGRLSVDSPFETFKEIVEVPPKSNTISAWAEMESYSEINDSDIYFFTAPTVNPTVAVECPEGMSAMVYFGHRVRDIAPGKIQAIPPPPARTHTWKAEAAMLPWHSVYIEWKEGQQSLGAAPARTKAEEQGQRP
jgi:hypothetical protein